ncbi:MAG: alpha/beta fold hydrolase [Microthrixaceae bacterium]|nr:alpha/beta fold hydrolase [Microthrixaceae bacterium]MCO5312569.1 alpha/beta fold hydrolase [Microthrixaceae bacterium]HPB45584.1 alpha/beta fold hydrolase [Microthrixaceae bacterium]
MTSTTTRAVLLHGFAQNRNCWGPLAGRLASERDVLALDLAGHGTASEVTADLWQSGQLVLDAIGDQPAAVIGYSMGARVALHAALTRPEAIDRLVLISGTAGIDDPNEREQRRVRDEALAERIEDLGIDAFLDEWLALPMFAGLTDETRFLEQRRTNTAAGLASALRHSGTGTQEPLWDRLGELTMPTLVIVGELDPTYEALGERLVDGIGDSSMFVVVGNSGHSPHLEQPEAVIDLITTWAAG